MACHLGFDMAWHGMVALYCTWKKPLAEAMVELHADRKMVLWEATYDSKNKKIDTHAISQRLSQASWHDTTTEKSPNGLPDFDLWFVGEDLVGVAD